MTHSSAAAFRHDEGAALLDFWRSEYAKHPVDLREPEPGVLIADMGHVRVTAQVAGRECRIEITAGDRSALPDYRSAISQAMKRFDPALPPLAWSGADPAGALPPTLAVGKVVACAPQGASWLRLSVALDETGYARFSSDAHWHFRLLRPVDAGRVPVWPRLDGNGVIQWPEGADRLSDRVFTVRACQPAARVIGFDIFRHPGGPTCDWADTTPVGQSVGLMGPGARGGPVRETETDRLVIGGDETSAPAILRALADMPAGAPVDGVLLVGSRADIAPVENRRRRLKWLLRSDGATEETLNAAMRDRLTQGCAWTRLWFAASKSSARAIRSFALHEAGLPKTHVHAVAYWS